MSIQSTTCNSNSNIKTIFVSSTKQSGEHSLNPGRQMQTRKKSDVNEIIVHCFDSTFGTEKLCNKWHTDPKPKGNGWDETGYHFIILNGFLTNNFSLSLLAGHITPARDLKYMGAHCKGHNKNSIGIALVGTTQFLEKQFESLADLCDALEKYYNKKLKISNHYDYDRNKTCPNFDAIKIIKHYRDKSAFRKLKVSKQPVSLVTLDARITALENR